MDASRALYPPALSHAHAPNGLMPEQAVDVLDGLLTEGPSAFDYTARNGPALARSVRMRCQYYYAMLQRMRRNLGQVAVPPFQAPTNDDDAIERLMELLDLTIEYLWGTYARRMHNNSFAWRRLVEQMREYAPMFALDRTMLMTDVIEPIIDAQAALAGFRHEVGEWRLRREAVLMSQHPRLGADSGLSRLGADVLARIV
jgi:hypothetical protein